MHRKQHSDAKSADEKIKQIKEEARKHDNKVDDYAKTLEQRNRLFQKQEDVVPLDERLDALKKEIKEVNDKLKKLLPELTEAQKAELKALHIDVKPVEPTSPSFIKKFME